MSLSNSLLNEVTEESRLLLQEISESNDRAAGITAGAVADDLLGILLHASMIEDDKLVTKLLDHDVSSFSTRIDLCYSLGLISEVERRDLHLLRNIRNEFAHSRKLVSFDDPGIRDRCRSFHLAQRFWSNVGSQPSDTKTWFLSAWVLLTNQLSHRVKQSQQAEKVPEMDSNVQIVFGGGSAAGVAPPN